MSGALVAISWGWLETVVDLSVGSTMGLEILFSIFDRTMATSLRKSRLRQFGRAVRMFVFPRSVPLSGPVFLIFGWIVSVSICYREVANRSFAWLC